MNPAKVHWRVNWRFAAILFGSVALSVAALFVWHHFQISYCAAMLLDRADRAERNGQPKQVVRVLRRYVGIVSDDDAAWARLAQAVDQNAKSADQKFAAARLYSRVLARPKLAEDRKMRLRSARLLYETGSFAPSVEQCDKLIAAGTADQARDAVALRALALHDQGIASPAVADWTAIANSLEAAIGGQPSAADDIDLVLRLAKLYRTEERVLAAPSQTGKPASGQASAWTQEKRNARADQLLDALVARHPESSKALLARYHYLHAYQLKGEQAALESALARASKSDGDVWIAAGGAALASANGRAGAVRQACRYFQSGIDASPHDRRGYLGLARALLLLDGIEHSADSLAQAEQVLAKAIGKFGPDDFEVKLWLGRVYLHGAQQKKLEATLGDLEGIIANTQLVQNSAYRARATAEVKRLRAEDLMNQGRHPEAVSQLERLAQFEQAIPVDPVPSGLANNPWMTWMMVGRCREAMGEPDRAARAYEQALKMAPTNGDLRLAAARAWTAAGRTDLAAVHVDGSLGQPTDAELVARAEHLIQQILGLPADSRDWREVRRLLNELRSNNRTHFQACLLAAQVEVQNGKTAEARKALEEAEKTPPASPAAWRSLALAYAGLQSAKDAERCVGKFAVGTSPGVIAILRSEMKLQLQELAAAEKILRDARSGASPADVDALDLALARLLAVQLRTAEAKQVLEPALHGDPLRHGDAVRLYANLCLVDQDWPALARAERLLQAVDGADATESKYYRARRLLDNTGGGPAALREAERLSEELSRSRSDWVQTLQIGGLLAERKEHDDQAGEIYERAMRISAGTAVEEQLAERLIELVVDGKGSDSARLESTIATSSALSRRAIARAVAEGKVQKAVSIASEGANQRPRDPVAQFWLGQTLQLNRQTAEAERAFRKATRMAPGFAAGWESLFAILAQTGQFADAKLLLTEIEKSGSLAEPGRSLLVARSQVVLGNVAAADAAYRDLIGRFPKQIEVLLPAIDFYVGRNPRRALRLARDAFAAAPDQGAVKRILATVLASDGSDAAFSEACRVLGATATNAPAEEVDLRQFAQILSRRPERERRMRAIEILSKLAHRKSFVPSQERLSLAHLMAAEGQFASALAELSALVTQSRMVVPDHLAEFVDSVIKWHASSTPEADRLAEQSLERLRRLEADSWRTQALGVRWASMRGRSADARSAVEAYSSQVASAKMSPGERAAALQRAAELCIEIKQPELAEQLARRAAVLDGSGRLWLAVFLVRNGAAKHSKEAIDLCLAANSDSAVDRRAVVIALGTVLSLGLPTEEQTSRAEALFQAAARTYAADAAVQFAVGSYWLMRGAEDKAIGALRRALELAPSNPHVMNNLAYTLVGVGEANEALALVDHAIALAGPISSFLDTRGLALLANRDYERAQLVFAELAKGASVEPVTYLHLAAAQYGSGKLAAARASLAQVSAEHFDGRTLPAPDQRRLAQLAAALQN